MRKLEELRLHRDELVKELQAAEKGDAQDLEASSSGLGDGDNDELSSCLEQLAVLKEKLNVYRLTGVSVIKSTGTDRLFSFSTSYKGQYLQPHYLQVSRQPTGLFSVSYHDLPPFVVCTVLPPDLVLSDMRTTARRVHELLAMMVFRREDLLDTEAKHREHLRVMECSEPYDVIQCRLTVSSDVQLDLALKYADLRTFVPSSVRLSPVRPDGREHLQLTIRMGKEVRALFAERCFSEAFPPALDLLTGELVGE